MEDFKPRLQLQFPLSASPNLPAPLCSNIMYLTFTVLSCSALCLSKPFSVALHPLWEADCYFITTWACPKCEGRVVAFQENGKPKRFPCQVKFILSYIISEHILALFDCHTSQHVYDADVPQHWYTSGFLCISLQLRWSHNYSTCYEKSAIGYGVKTFEGDRWEISIRNLSTTPTIFLSATWFHL